MVKVVSLFLIFILVLAMFGRLRFPKLPSLKGRKRVAKAQKCKHCGGYKINGQPCPCGK